MLYDVDPRHGWLLIQVDIKNTYTIKMVLDTGSARSALSRPSYELLHHLNLLAPYGTGRYLIQGLEVEGQRFPDLIVSVRRRVIEVGANGIVGLDFLGQLREIYFERATMRLSLRGWSSR